MRERKNKLKCVEYGVAGVAAFVASGWFFLDTLLAKSLTSGVICWLLLVLSCFLMLRFEKDEEHLATQEK